MLHSSLPAREKKALVACLPDPSGNPRPYRTIKLLHNIGFDVYSLSQKPKIKIDNLIDTYEIAKDNISFFKKIINLISIFFIRIAALLKINIFFVHGYSFVYGISAHNKEILSDFDVIIVEDLTLLPFCLTLKNKKNRVFFDAREYYPREKESSVLFRYFVAPEKRILCKKFLPLVDHLYTVSPGLAALYQKELSCKAEVIRSTPFYVDMKPKMVSSFPVKLVHHGIANRDRCIENMIDVIVNLKGRYHLDLFLTGNKRYIRELRARALNCPYISFKNPVSFLDINTMLSNYDLGFYLLAPTGLNTTYSLPNKFFEFIQARIGIIIGPSPEMARIGNQYGLALISDDYTVESMVKLLQKVTLEQINQVKINSHRAAKELSWETESERLKRIILDRTI